MNKEWYKTIARSHYDGRRWVFDHPEDMRVRSQDFGEKLFLALQKLRVSALEAIEVFNHYSVSQAHIMPLILTAAQHPDRVTGLMLLRYSLQLKMVLDDNRLVLTLVQLSSFQPKVLAESQLYPQEDDMSNIVWQTPSGQIWDEDQLMKSALKILVKHGQSQSSHEEVEVSRSFTQGQERR